MPRGLWISTPRTFLGRSGGHAQHLRQFNILQAPGAHFRQFLLEISQHAKDMPNIYNWMPVCQAFMKAIPKVLAWPTLFIIWISNICHHTLLDFHCELIHSNPNFIILIPLYLTFHWIIYPFAVIPLVALLCHYKGTCTFTHCN